MIAFHIAALGFFVLGGIILLIGELGPDSVKGVGIISMLIALAAEAVYGVSVIINLVLH